MHLDLFEEFYSLVRQIPRGRVSTYGSLARALGDIRAARACGYMLSVNPDPDVTPCYRVIRTGGEVGKYTHPSGDKEKKRRLLEDGIGITDGRVDDYDSLVFTDFKSNSILKKIQEEQRRFAGLLSNDTVVAPSSISAFDVSYHGEAGVGAMITSKGDRTETRTSSFQVAFPYISSYLAYREIPVLAELLNESGDFLVFDGNGILHPRRMGLAAFGGLLLGKPSLGVAKSLAMGKITGDGIFVGEEEVGFVYKEKYYVSPGNMVSVDSARTLMKDYGRRIISQLKSAHREANLERTRN